MSHPLFDIVNAAEGFLLVGDSSQDRFPGFSYDAYTKAGKRFYCLDMGGLTESRGPTKGGKVYATVDDLPPLESDLAIVWVKPKRALDAVELAHKAGARRVWFSFHSGHPGAIARGRELGMEVVEVGRCPIYYLDRAPPACRAHRLLARATGTVRRPPQTELDRDQRIMW